MRKNYVKRILATLLSMVMAISMNAVVFAADFDTPVDPGVPEDPQVIGSLLTSCGDSMSGGFGSISCYLASGNSNADICAGVSPSGVGGSVSCYVIFPNGAAQYLGSVPASGGNTGYFEFSYCPAGTYTFEFYASSSATLYI